MSDFPERIAALEARLDGVEVRVEDVRLDLRSQAVLVAEQERSRHEHGKAIRGLEVGLESLREELKAHRAETAAGFDAATLRLKHLEVKLGGAVGGAGVLVAVVAKLLGVA